MNDDKLARRDEGQIDAYKRGLADGLAKRGKGGDGPSAAAFRCAAVVFSGLGAQLKRDRDLGVCIELHDGTFVDDKFVVEAMKEFMRELRKIDPATAEELRTGSPLEWRESGDDDLGILNGDVYDHRAYEDGLRGGMRDDDEDD